MIIIQKIATLLSPLLLLAGFEAMLRGFISPWVLLGIQGAIIFFTVLKLKNWKIASKEFWIFLLSPLTLIISTIGFLIIIEGKIWPQIIMAISVFIYALYLEHMFKFLHQPPSYQPYSLENTSMYANIMSLFYTASTTFGLKMFLGVKSWQLVSPLALIVILLIIQTMWIHKIAIKGNKHCIMIITLVILENYWAIHFLPTNHLVNALLLTTVFYVLINSSRLYLNGILTASSVKKHLLVAGLIFLITLGSSRWI